MARKSLYLIDGHSQIYRAYYAPFGNLTSPKGEPTRAVHVFIQMILNLLRDRKPDYLALAMDVSDSTVFRVEIANDYKANRDHMPEDLPPQIDRIVSILQLMRVPILRCQGMEADDIMATLARRLASDELDVLLVSRDKDLDQLINDRVRLYDPSKDRVLDAAAVLEEKGYTPAQAVEAQMLMGDSTDNIRGADGVGPKKAAQLLQKYGSVDAIIAHADELTPKLKENILEFASRGDVVRQLVTLRQDAPVELDLDSADITRFSPTAASSILTELGLHRLLDRVQQSPPPPDQSRDREGAVPAHDPTLFPVHHDSQKPRDTDRKEPSKPPSQTTFSDSFFSESLFPESPDSTPTAADLSNLETADSRGRFILIDTPEALADLAAKLARAQRLAFDTETTGLVPADADLVGISIAIDGETGYYLPVRGPGQTLPAESIRQHLGPIFADSKIPKRGQNAKFDLTVLHAFGIPVAGLDFDSMVASFVLDSSRRSHGLDALAAELLNYRAIPIDELIGKGKSQITLDRVPIDRVCRYAAEDAVIAFRLCEVLESNMTDPELTKLFHEVELPLVEVLADIERLGVAIDTDRLARLSNEMADQLVELERKIHAAAGHPFNINSTKQLAEVLYDERRLRVIKRTKTGRSTDADVLEQLAAESTDPVPKLVVEYRELSKLKGTYVDALPELVSAKSGRIHPSFHQTGAVTGRLSCSDPNLQNIPIRTDLGAPIRRAFVPGLPDHVLLKADYSQIELRVLAHFCGDDALREAFIEDRDIHAFVAAQLAGIPLDQVTKDQRGRAKTVNFGIVYGQSAFGLARQTGMSQSEAKLFIERYFARYPKIRGFLDDCIAHARRLGYVKTILGRRRAIPDIHSRNQTARNAAERFAVNTVVQGSAADLIKVAMINIHRRIRDESRPARMILQVHDELVFEVPRDALKTESEMIAHEMSTALRLDVPIKVDLAAGENWLDTVPLRIV